MSKTTTILSSITIIGALLLGGAGAAGATTDATVSSPADAVTSGSLATIAALLPACEVEDGRNCYWNAAESGNGLGYSFIDIDGEVYYLSASARAEG